MPFTQQDYEQDSYACEKDMRQSAYFGGGIAGGIEMNQFFNKCMVAHGWVLQQRAEKSPARDAYIASMKISLEQFKADADKCSTKNTGLKSRAAKAKCASKQMQEIFESNGFPRMDLIEKINQKRLELAEKLDRKQIAESDANKEYHEYAARLLNGGTPQ